MNVFDKNREKAKQFFANSPGRNPGKVLTGNVGELNFALLPQVESGQDEYLVARWEEMCYRAGPGRTWVEYGKKVNLCFRGQPLTLLERHSSQAPWKLKDGIYFNNEKFSFYVYSATDGSVLYKLDEGQLLPAVKQNDCVWILKFEEYYGHHFGSTTYHYKLAVDLSSMEIRNQVTSFVDTEN